MKYITLSSDTHEKTPLSSEEISGIGDHLGLPDRASAHNVVARSRPKLLL